MPVFCVLLAAPTGHRLNFLPHFGSFLNEPQEMGPLDEPSQVLQPIAHLQETDALITLFTQAAGLSGGGGESSASARAGRWLRVWGVGGGDCLPIREPEARLAILPRDLSVRVRDRAPPGLRLDARALARRGARHRTIPLQRSREAGIGDKSEAGGLTGSGMQRRARTPHAPARGLCRSHCAERGGRLRRARPPCRRGRGQRSDPAGRCHRRRTACGHSPPERDRSPAREPLADSRAVQQARQVDAQPAVGCSQPTSTRTSRSGMIIAIVIMRERSQRYSYIEST